MRRTRASSGSSRSSGFHRGEALELLTKLALKVENALYSHSME